MSSARGDPEDNLERRVEALVNTIREAERELQELSGGQLDAVMSDGEGVLLLRSAQMQLLASEAEQRELAATQVAILDALPAHVALLESQSVIQAVNGAWRRFAIANGARDSLLGVGENYLEVCDRARGVSAAGAAEVAGGIRGVLAGTIPEFSFEYPCDSPTAKRWFRLTVTPLQAGGPSPGAVVMHVDVTERRKSEQRLRDQAALLDAAKEAILVKDSEDRILYWNRGAEETYAWTAREVMNRRAVELFQADPSDYEKAWRELRETGAWQGEIAHRDAKGHLHTMNSTWTLVRDTEGRPERVLSIGADVTERRVLEAQLLRAQRLESIGTLAGGIAHDLNNVLAPMLMACEILRENESTPERLELIGTIESSARRGAAMVRQVLAFSRGVSGKREIVDAGAMVRDLLHVVRDSFPKNIELETRASEDLWPVMGDSTQIHQVLLNLCVNARDAMPYGGRLALTLENRVLDELYSRTNPEARPGRFVVISVVDNGVGMSPEVREKIFEPFFTTKESGSGTGLGLSTVHTIVKSHGGFVTVYSEPGRGASFVVYLPASTDPLETETAAIEEALLPRGQGELVLIVDDEEAIREVTRRTLERFGYKVLLAANGAEAVALYAENRSTIAVVLTDMSMPVMDGPATIHALRALDPQVRIVGSSGFGSDGRLSKAVAAGVHHFVPKPYTGEALLKALRQALAER